MHRKLMSGFFFLNLQTVMFFFELNFTHLLL
jgi:hypothetical protein